MKGTDRLNKLSESQTLSITKDVRKLIGEGKDIVGLTLGEPDFDTPDHIRQAAIEAINEGFTHYPPVAGIPELREAVAQKFRRENKLQLKAENVVVSTGAKQALVNVIMSLVNPGDEVIMSAPYWVSYMEMLKMADAVPVIVETEIEHKFKMTPAQLDAAITPKTRLVILNSPNNPTGVLFRKQELDGLVEVLARYPEVFILTDDIYEHITYGPTAHSLACYEEIAERTIVVNGVSKAYAMTGWRIGYVGAPRWIAELCEKYQGQITSGASSISQRAALAALNGPNTSVNDMVHQFQTRRDWMEGELEEIDGLKSYLPEGAFYFYPDLSAFFGRKTPDGEVIRDIDHLCRYMLLQGHVAVIPGTAFGTTKHVRISYAYALDTLKKGMHNLQSALYALK